VANYNNIGSGTTVPGTLDLDFKLATLAYKAIHSGQPGFLPVLNGVFTGLYHHVVRALVLVHNYICH